MHFHNDDLVLNSEFKISKIECGMIEGGKSMK